MKKLLYEGDLKENPSVEIGKKAPDFVLNTSAGDEWRLSDHLGKVIALLFYPKNETLVCTRQMCSVRDNWRDYLETKAEIIGISPGTTEDHKAFAEKHELPFQILADVERKITEQYGFHWFFPTFFVRTIVIIDAEGLIRSRRVMLRAFRPTDRSVIRSIYTARADALKEKYKTLKIKKKDE